MRFDSLANRILNRLAGSKNGIARIEFEVRGRLFKVLSPDDQYWGGIKDILLNREYEYPEEFELQKFRGLVVDAGAHVGLFSIVSSVFARRVIAIEPNSENYSLLRMNFDFNKICNAVALNKALTGAKTEKVRLYQGIDSGCNSIIQGSNKRFSLVNCITLQEIIDEYGEIDLLKLDTEGAEFDIFGQADIECLRRINAIVGEIHLGSGKSSAITTKLAQCGFTATTLRSPLVKKSGRYTIKVHKLVKLKITKKLVYILSAILGLKDRNQLILFARRN